MKVCSLCSPANYEPNEPQFSWFVPPCSDYRVQISNAIGADKNSKITSQVAKFSVLILKLWKLHSD